MICATYAITRYLALKLSKNWKKCVFMTWQLFWAIPAQVFFHSLWVPFGHIFYFLENPYVYVLPWSPNLTLKTRICKKLYFFSFRWVFCWAQTPKPYNFTLILTITWIIYMEMRKIWVGHFPGLVWNRLIFSESLMLKIENNSLEEKQNILWELATCESLEVFVVSYVSPC